MTTYQLALGQAQHGGRPSPSHGEDSCFLVEGTLQVDFANSKIITKKEEILLPTAYTRL